MKHALSDPRIFIPPQRSDWIPSRLHMQTFLNMRPGGTPPYAGDMDRFAAAAAEANRTRLKAAHRLAVATHFHRWFRERLNYWYEYACAQEAKGQNQARWDLIRSVEELATAFKVVVAQGEQEESRNRPGILATAVLSALEIHVLLMRLLVERYREVPPRLWKESHALFSIAREHGLALRAQRASSGDTVCIQQIYTQLCLIGIVDAYRQAPGLLPWIVAYLHKYAAALSLTPYRERPVPVGADSLPAIFLIDPDAERGPIAPWHMYSEHDWLSEDRLPHCLVLDAEPLEELLPEHLRLLNEGEDPALIHETLAQLPAAQRQELIERIWSALLPDAREATRKDVWGIPVRLYPQIQNIVLRLRQGDTRRFDYTLADAADTQSAEFHSVTRAACSWQLVDVSNTGMRIVCDYATAPEIEVGQVVGIEPADPADVDWDAVLNRFASDLPSPTQVAVTQVRWVRQNLRGGIQMGLRNLGKQVRAAALTLDESPVEGESIPIILLQQDGRHHLLLSGTVSPQGGATGLLMETADGVAGTRRIRLGPVVVKTRYFRQIEFTYLPST